MIIDSTVPGKLLLFGEHVVLSGAPGIATTLPLSLNAELALGIQALAVTAQTEHIETIKKIAELQWNMLAPDKQMHGRLSVRSKIPVGQGFGSSAALCTALALIVLHTSQAEATCKQYEQEKAENSQLHSASLQQGQHETAYAHVDSALLDEYARNDVWRLAHEGEKLIHGTPSGIDTGAVLHQGLNAFYGFEHFPPQYISCKPLGGWLVWGYIPRVSPARASIERVAGLRNTSAYQELMEIAQESFVLVTTSCRSTHDIDSFGALADRAMTCFDALGISAPGMNKITETAKAQGALGGKLCGAGMGGAFWFLLKTYNEACMLKNCLLLEKLCSFAELAEI